MPFRNFYLPSPERLVIASGQEQHIDNSFLKIPYEVIENDTPGMAVDEWDSWLKWDGTMEVLPSFNSRRQSMANSPCGSEPSGPDAIRNPEPIIYSEDDALFEIDEPSLSPPVLSQSFTENDDTKPDLSSIGQTVENPGRPLHAYSTLSAVEERRLRDIAMPNYTTARIINIEEQDTSAAIAVKVRDRPHAVKRKCSTLKEDQIDLYQFQKQSHNIIEKRYRINLNNKLDKLRQRIPKFHDTPSKMTEGDEETSYKAESPSSYKFGKAAILTSAVEYISQLENSTQRLGMETAALKARLAAFEKLAMAGSIFSGGEIYPDTPILECLGDFEQATTSKAEATYTDSSHDGRNKRLHKVRKKVDTFALRKGKLVGKGPKDDFSSRSYRNQGL